MVEREEQMLTQIEQVEKNQDALKGSKIKILQESKPSQAQNSG